METFRIYTEDKNASGIERETAKLFTGATFLTGTGLYAGETEPSRIIEIVTDESEHHAVEALAERIKKMNHQSAVLVTETPTQSEVV